MIYSLWTIFSVKKYNTSCDAPCWHEPFDTFLDGRSKVSISDFWDAMPGRWDPHVTRNFRARNYQSFELGMDHLNDDDDYIQGGLQVSRAPNFLQDKF